MTFTKRGLIIDPHKCHRMTFGVSRNIKKKKTINFGYPVSRSLDVTVFDFIY